MQPDPIGFLCILTRIVRQFLPNAFCSFRLVRCQAWTLVVWCRREKRSQNSAGNRSRRVLAHWPSLINVGPVHSMANSSQRHHSRVTGCPRYVTGYNSMIGVNVKIIRLNLRTKYNTFQILRRTLISIFLFFFCLTDSFLKTSLGMLARTSADRLSVVLPFWIQPNRLKQGSSACLPLNREGNIFLLLGNWERTETKFVLFSHEPRHKILTNGCVCVWRPSCCAVTLAGQSKGLPLCQPVLSKHWKLAMGNQWQSWTAIRMISEIRTHWHFEWLNPHHANISTAEFVINLS